MCTMMGTIKILQRTHYISCSTLFNNNLVFPISGPEIQVEKQIIHVLVVLALSFFFKKIMVSRSAVVRSRRPLRSTSMTSSTTSSLLPHPLFCSLLLLSDCSYAQPDIGTQYPSHVYGRTDGPGTDGLGASSHSVGPASLLSARNDLPEQRTRMEESAKAQRTKKPKARMQDLRRF